MHGLPAGGTAYIKQRPIVFMPTAAGAKNLLVPRGLFNLLRYQHKHDQHPLAGKNFKSQAGEPCKHKAPGVWISDLISSDIMPNCTIQHDLLASPTDFRHPL